MNHRFVEFSIVWASGPRIKGFRQNADLGRRQGLNSNANMFDCVRLVMHKQVVEAQIRLGSQNMDLPKMDQCCTQA